VLVPLSATLIARPARVCVLVPLYPDVPWEASVEHALACQARYWGGHGNLVVPLVDGLAADEVFWRLIRQYDPDLIALHAPTLGDVEEIAPALCEAAISRLRTSLARDGFDGPRIEEHVREVRGELFWDVDLPADLGQGLVRWVAPFHHRSEPRSILMNGSDSVAHELTDVLKLTTLPPRFENLRISTHPVDQLLLTGSVGRFTRSTARCLVERGVSVEERELQSLTEAVGHLWPRERSACPLTLPETGLARRAGAGLIEVPLVVVGDDPRDWLLYKGLQTLRPLVYWLPESRFDERFFIELLLHELHWVARSAGVGEASVSVVSASSGDAAERATAEILPMTRNRRDALGPQLADWRDFVPRAPFWPADPRSIRTTPLLRSAGTTEELPTPIPAAFAPDDLVSSGWVVDVDVRDWSTFRHPLLGARVLPGSFASPHDQRVSAGGPSYFGLAAFVQTGLGLENALSRRQLAPMPVLDALSEALSGEGWSIRLSDKGAYAQRSAQLLGGVEELAQALRDQQVRLLLDAYMSDRRSNAPGLFLTDTRRRYLSLEEAAALLGDSAEDVVNRLYASGALTRGHALKCEQCRATSFYSLTEHQRFTCRRCRHEQRATRASWLGDPEPIFRYELAEVIYQLLDNDGDIALLAAYDYFVSMLGARDRRPLDLGFEIEVISSDGMKSEHDIVAVWGSDLWLGEATKNEDLGSQEVARLRRLKDLAELLAARGVLFATTGEFSTRTRERVNSVFGSWPQPEVAIVERLVVAPTRESGVPVETPER
jgi:hypothetical protein